MYLILKLLWNLKEVQTPKLQQCRVSLLILWFCQETRLFPLKKKRLAIYQSWKSNSSSTFRFQFNKTKIKKLQFLVFTVHFSQWCDPGNWTAGVPDEYFPLGGTDNRVTLNNTLDYTEAKVSEPRFLPPASEGWRKVMFSLCPPLQGVGYYHLADEGEPPSQVQAGGGYPLPKWGGILPSQGIPTFQTGSTTLPGRGGGNSLQAGEDYLQVGRGTTFQGGGRGTTSMRVLGMRRAVCLLRSSRRTFLFEMDV